MPEDFGTYNPDEDPDNYPEGACDICGGGGIPNAHYHWCPGIEEDEKMKNEWFKVDEFMPPDNEWVAIELKGRGKVEAAYRLCGSWYQSESFNGEILRWARLPKPLEETND